MEQFQPDWRFLTEEERYAEWSDKINQGLISEKYTKWCDRWDMEWEFVTFTETP